MKKQYKNKKNPAAEVLLVEKFYENKIRRSQNRTLVYFLVLYYISSECFKRFLKIYCSFGKICYLHNKETPAL